MGNFGWNASFFAQLCSLLFFFATMPAPPSIRRQLQQAQRVDERAEQARRVVVAAGATANGGSSVSGGPVASGRTTAGPTAREGQSDHFSLHSTLATENESNPTEHVERKGIQRERRRQSDVKSVQVRKEVQKL